jgi:hypothetical protein
LLVQLRGGFEPAFVRICAWITTATAVLATLTALAIDPQSNAAGYRLDADFLDPIRAVCLALLLFSLAHVYFLRKPEEAFLAQATGATTAGLGVVALVLLASLLRLPAWSIAGPLLAFFAGSLSLGAATVAMIWGHWYLVKPSLDERPLNEMTLLVLAALLAEIAIVALNATVPVGEPFESDALLAVELQANPAFWLRMIVGLLFPALLAFMAYKSSAERSMMSATGLLYIAVGAVLAGEALGRGLLFVTGSPV